MNIIMKLNNLLTVAACSAVAFYAGSHMGFLDGDVFTLTAAAGAIFASATAHA